MSDMRLLCTLLVIFTMFAGCEQPSDEPPDGGGDGGTGLPRYATRLDDVEDIAALAVGDLSVKYLAPLAPSENPPPVDNSCVFQDMHDAVWHIEFLVAFEGWSDLQYETYLNLVLRRETRTMWGGSIRHWPDAVHPDSGRAGLVSFSVYAEDTAGNELSVADVIAVHDQLTGCMGFDDEMVVFVAEGVAQRELIDERAEEFAAAGIVATDAATLAGDVEYEVYSEGTGYGTLVIVPANRRLEEYGPRDVLVVESAPNDIGIVSGLITSQPQSLHSHVNLRLDEKDIPNVRIPNATVSPFLLGLEGRLIRIEAFESGVDIMPASLEEAQDWWDAHRPDVGQPRADLSVIAIAGFEEIGSEDAEAYGVKAANLAELSNEFGPDHAPTGFAIPFAGYLAHVEENGVDVMIDDFLVDPRRYTDAEFRRGALDDIRDAIRDAPVDPGLLSDIEELLRGWLGDAAETTRLRFRSSTNVEDLEALTGAGLYDSRSGCLGDDLDGDEEGPSVCLSEEEASFLNERLSSRRAELAAHPERIWLEEIIADIEGDLTEEKSIARALPRVWRSLWNDRAWEEREYYGIEHSRAFMGIAVNPAFSLERLNAVVLTNLELESGDPLYRIVSQIGSESVVRPDDPTAVAEVRSVRRGAGDELLDDTVWVRSSLGGEEDLWSGVNFETLMQVVFAVHDHFSLHVYDDEAIPLDLEVKLTSDGRIVVKQVRPYVQGGP